MGFWNVRPEGSLSEKGYSMQFLSKIRFFSITIP